MSVNIPSRQEVPIHNTWDLTHIFKTDYELYKKVDKLETKSVEFKANFFGVIKDSKRLLEAIDFFEDMEKDIALIRNYVDLALSVDQTNTDSLIRTDKINTSLAIVSGNTSFFYIELVKLPESEIKSAIQEKPELAVFINKNYKRKSHLLDEKVEEVLANFNSVFLSPRAIYNTIKLIDMRFDDFLVDDKKYSLSYNLFENEYEIEPNHQLRREAFNKFSQKLNEYKNITAKAYEMKLKIEKANSDLRGFDNIFEYLLYDQAIEREIFDRQIDFTFKYLAPHMRRYVQLIKEVNNLDKLTFADLKIAIDPDYEPKISFEKAKDYVLEALDILGPEYVEIINEAFGNRWIDHGLNVGKSTGAFCYTPYGSHPYILMTFMESMRDVFVLAHELGHGGHFHLSNRYQNILNTIPSEYFFEAPSTMNEMLLANYLIKKSKDARFKRWVLSNVISRTYFHNFVTHLLEAAFQREVYKMVDEGKSITADILCNIKRNLLEEFWGEEIEINEGAELTWMRQPHYYLGLYPYTYSTGLTIATSVSRKILEDGQVAVDRWLDVLKAGGTKSPYELALTAGVDVRKDETLLETINYIGSLIEEVFELSRELGDIK
ncbi:oligoendopeptidase F [Ornithinibacillus sp. 4-3]|uniref:Oligopeptidase F n=1 Tax=Ornithinibacillus sp. 4-3 TaxID=3231488 RepID=A0AB39HNT1_9BACI